MLYTNHYNTKKTPQTEPIPGSSQIPNSGGGYSYSISDWDRLTCFLILGSEGGSYYVSERALTLENSKSIVELIKKDGLRVVKETVAISDAGRAPKNDPAIFALALAATFGDAPTKKAAYASIPSVCRIGTHLFTFCAHIQVLRGWSRGLRKGVAAFYNKPEKDVAHQLIKYRQRNGWTHRDVMRLAHPHPTSEGMQDLFRYAVGKSITSSHPLIEIFEEVQNTKDVKKVCTAILEYSLPREAIPNQFLNEKSVWEALLQKMPLTALIRNLAKMTQVGLLSSAFDESVKKVVGRLTDMEGLKKARVHPLSVLNALKVYVQGHGDKGSLTWTPVAAIVGALGDAFEASFGTVTPTNKNLLIGLDVSSSMMGNKISGTSLDARTASAAMAMLHVRTEPTHEIMAFSDKFVKFPINKSHSLDTVISMMNAMSFGATDCSLPMRHAIKANLPIDSFIVYTDSETNSGPQHPSQALRQYRDIMGKPAKLIVVGMVSNGFTIADPDDGGMLDVVGFDTATPNIMSEFIISSQAAE